uniref:Carbamoyl phosphate synthase small chain n=1 Tax=Vertebrata lanosa TaxID=1261582 RepID=A0A0B5W603_9FLOR|nr:carbamoyl-phosphate synthase small chain [Vertebrata lanosa]AJH66046.1 carbamoyl-phosphate synthase small chain [Vertebrata lanosa]
MSYSLCQSVLSLQDGTFYRGWSFFDLSNCTGEIVFNTGMTGYQEIISDPSYSGQMVVFTYPEIGNTGLNENDIESNFIHVKALVAKNISSLSSNWRSKVSLKDYILQKRIPHIFGLDTRSITRHLRAFGVMSSLLCSADVFAQLLSCNRMDLNSLDLIRKITVRNKYIMFDKTFDNLNLVSSFYINPSNEFYTLYQYKIVVLDFGLKFNILRHLLSFGCDIYILPATCTYDDILKCEPDAIVLSNGPGNPLLADYAINIVQKLVNFSNVPIFGICMGHQILNLSFGANTSKLKFGHRGLNHPSGFNNYSEITSQNHGFVVEGNDSFNINLSKFVMFKYFNLNDLTIAATFHQSAPFFSVQYHPEASPGPHDSQYLFEVFMKLINLVKLPK